MIHIFGVVPYNTEQPAEEQNFQMAEMAGEYQALEAGYQGLNKIFQS